MADKDITDTMMDAMLYAVANFWTRLMFPDQGQNEGQSLLLLV